MDHPEETCQKCGGRNIVWFTSNDTWNRVMGNDGGILCPICFADAAKTKGIDTTWRLTPEEHG